MIANGHFEIELEFSKHPAECLGRAAVLESVAILYGSRPNIFQYMFGKAGRKPLYIEIASIS